uniref:Uncharacterized protein n=1 Tax=Anguilla anguilla TaxID=7936 RepID=A0A0E9TCG7_ANGAN
MSNTELFCCFKDIIIIIIIDCICIVWCLSVSESAEYHTPEFSCYTGSSQAPRPFLPFLKALKFL